MTWVNDTGSNQTSGLGLEYIGFSHCFGEKRRKFWSCAVEGIRRFRLIRVEKHPYEAAFRSDVLLFIFAFGDICRSVTRQTGIRVIFTQQYPVNTGWNPLGLIPKNRA
jgi:hypothetical protein